MLQHRKYYASACWLVGWLVGWWSLAVKNIFGLTGNLRNVFRCHNNAVKEIWVFRDDIYEHVCSLIWISSRSWRATFEWVSQCNFKRVWSWARMRMEVTTHKHYLDVIQSVHWLLTLALDGTLPYPVTTMRHCSFSHNSGTIFSCGNTSRNDVKVIMPPPSYYCCCLRNCGS
jgi:hypothetical protein